MKNFEHDYIHDTGVGALGGVSILIRKNVPQSKINTNTHLHEIAVSATLHKTVCPVGWSYKNTSAAPLVTPPIQQVSWMVRFQ